jgi:hypothetical protein
MRYHFIPLGLVFGLLAGCGDDPTAPVTVEPTGPQVDAGQAKPIPIKDPGLCLQRNQLSARVDQGGFELLPHPVCPKVR